jgi:hypothetical protein
MDLYLYLDWFFKSDFDSSNFHAFFFFFFFFCKMVMYIWRKAKDNCIYYLSHWNIKTVQSKSATREYLGTLITILQLTSSSLMSISWVYSLFPVLYINTVKSVFSNDLYYKAVNFKLCISDKATTCLMWSFFNVPLEGHEIQVWLYNIFLTIIFSQPSIC